MSDVNTPSAEYKRLAQTWHLPRTLMGGTRAMRKAATLYLPKEPAESSAAYGTRLKRTTLFNGFRKTVKDMTGKVFNKAVTLEKDVPEKLKGYAENIDLAGRHINVFARDVFYDAMQTGIAHILVDMPPALQGATRAQEQAAGIRPYLCHVKCEDVIGWQTANVGGVVTLVQIRIRELVGEKDGEFGEVMVPQVRVLYPGRWEIWREATDGREKGNWVKVREGVSSVPKITLATVYINRTGFMAGEPPLEDLADLNVTHWQSSSDQRNILHVARVPILFGAGFSDDAELTIGASSMVRNSDKDAKLTWVEHTGQAISAGREDLKDLEFQMQTQGLQLLIPKPGRQTATGEMRDDSKENSPLAMMAVALQDGLEAAFGFMAEYDGLGEDKGGSIVVNKDFGITAGAAEDLRLLLDAVNAGQISKETFWLECQRRGLLSDSFNPEVEKDRIASEAPDLDAETGMDLGR